MPRPMGTYGYRGSRPRPYTARRESQMLPLGGLRGQYAAGRAAGASFVKGRGGHLDKYIDRSLTQLEEPFDIMREMGISDPRTERYDDYSVGMAGVLMDEAARQGGYWGRMARRTAPRQAYAARSAATTEFGVQRKPTLPATPAAMHAEIPPYQRPKLPRRR